MKLRSLIPPLLLATIVLPARADGGLEKVLVPVTLGDTIAGAHGSLWKVFFGVHNAGLETATYRESPQPCAILCTDDRLAPGVTYNQPPLPDWPASGTFVYVEEGSDFVFSLRIRDLSRQLKTWGTEIPVIREGELLPKAVLFPIPMAPEFRQTLRIYDWHGRVGNFVTVRLLDIATNELLAEEVMQFSTSVAEPSFHEPGFIQITNLADHFSGIRELAEVRVEVIGTGESPRIWAFVSVTNNQTQHVTAVTPQ